MKNMNIHDYKRRIDWLIAVQDTKQEAKARADLAELLAEL